MAAPGGAAAASCSWAMPTSVAAHGLPTDTRLGMPMPAAQCHSTIRNCESFSSHGLQTDPTWRMLACPAQASCAIQNRGDAWKWGGKSGGYGRKFRENSVENRFIANAEKKKRFSFGDQLLDYIEGGPKLRKWYGAPDQLPSDAGANRVNSEEEKEPEELEEDVVRDVVLVTDADSETGQLIVLELILRRLRVRAIVKDIKAATVGFGAYVEPVEDIGGEAALKRALRGVRAIICPSKVTLIGSISSIDRILSKAVGLANKELLRGVEHIILLSKLTVNRNQGGLGSLFGGLDRREAEESEAAISSLGIPYTIVRAGALKDDPGGQLGFRYGQGGDVQGTISRQDAAFVCAEALDSPPQNALVFDVVNGKEEVDDWSEVFTSMTETTIR